MRTGRPPLSDEEKRRRGTLDPRYTEAARAARQHEKVVSIFGGDAVDQIPPPPNGLVPKAVEEYWKWTRRLHEQGRLTQVWLERVLLFAVRKHTILHALAAGKVPKEGDVKAAEMFLKELGALNVDQPAAGQVNGGSKFGHIGFAARERRG